MSYSFRFIRLLSLFVLLPACFAQQAAPSGGRPKVGLALEGGGALGLAHIGVLKWFEANRIPVDFVAGTSMGGLVGGMYATGMRGADLQEFISKIEWNEALDGQSPYQALAFRRKEDKRAFQNNLEFGLRNGFSLPGGLSSGQRITYLFDREALPYSDLKTFDDLPIPFRCVATDLTSGKQHVFSSGPLGQALRATMSLPAVFTPVRQDQSLWADGGLLNNLPVDVVRKMGADIVIAVVLKTAPFDPNKKQSMFSVMDRSISVMIEAGELHNLETADLVLTVDLSDFTSSQYSESEKIISKGRDAAGKKAQMLARLAIPDEAAWQQHLAARDSRRRSATAEPAFVQVTGTDKGSAAAIEQKLSAHVGKPLNLDKLEHDIDLVIGNGRYTRFSYQMTSANGKPGLAVRGEEKDYAPPLVNIGFLVDGSDVSNVRWTTTARITAMDVGGYRSEWRTDFSVGSIWGAATEYYRPLTPTSKWFVAPRAFVSSVPLDVYDHSEHVAQYRIRRYGGGLDMVYSVDRFSEVRFGYEIGDFNSEIQIGAPVLPTPHGRTGMTAVRYTLDHLDSPTVPRTGQYVRFRTGWADASPGATKGFPLSEAAFGVIRPFNRRGSGFIQGSGGTTWDHDSTGMPQFFIGGAGQLNAYGRGELRTNDYWLGRVGYIYELFTMPPLLGKKAYLTSAFDVAKAYRAPGASSLPLGGNLGLVIETLVGPLFVGGAYGDSGHKRVYFSLGRFF